MNSIFQRRSIRSFLQKEIEESKIEQILKAGMQSPSSRNKQPWEFIVLTDREKIIDASQFSRYGAKAMGAGCIIITLANMELTNNDQRWFSQDMASCTQNMLLQTVEENLGGFWIGIFPNEERMQPIVDYFKLEKHLIPFSMIAIGYTKEENKFIDRYHSEKVHWNRY